MRKDTRPSPLFLTAIESWAGPGNEARSSPLIVQSLQGIEYMLLDIYPYHRDHGRNHLGQRSRTSEGTVLVMRKIRSHHLPQNKDVNSHPQSVWDMSLMNNKMIGVR